MLRYLLCVWLEFPWLEKKINSDKRIAVNAYQVHCFQNSSQEKRFKIERLFVYIHEFEN